jgi:hypothetical protein
LDFTRVCQKVGTGEARRGNRLQFRFADHLLDTERRELRRGDTPVALEPQVFDLLVHLVQNRDRVADRWQNRGASLAQRFDDDTRDPFELQDEIRPWIAVALHLEMIAAEAARPTDNPDALD